MFRYGVSKQKGTSGKFSSYLVLLQFTNDMSMQGNAQNMVSCCYNRRFYTCVPEGESCGYRTLCRQTEWRKSRALPPTSSDLLYIYIYIIYIIYIYNIYFSNISPGHTLTLVSHGLPPDGRSLLLTYLLHGAESFLRS